MLLPAEKLRNRVEELALEIDAHYAGRDVTLVVVLKGAFVFAADLIRLLKTPVAVELICLATYGDDTSPGANVCIEADTGPCVEGRELLIVEDVVDTGRSMGFLIDHFYSRGAADVRLCVLLDKPARRQVRVDPHFVGFAIPDVFVVGYGIDYAQDYRGLPDVHALAEDQ